MVIKLPDTFLYHVEKLTLLAQDVSQIILRPDTATIPAYESGQYINVLHPNQHVSSLSIACAPTDGSLEFHLFHPATNKHAQDLLRMATVDKQWQLEGPHGVCTVSRLDKDSPIIFIAYGTGFAPIKAVMETLLQQNHLQPMQLFWSGDCYYSDLLQQWQQTYPTFSFTAFPKHVDLHTTIVNHHKDLANHQVYAVGSRQLMQTALNHFEQHGLPKHQFFSDMI